MAVLTQEILKSLLHYDPDTGVFGWIAKTPNAKIGTVAGCLTSQGYLQIKLCKQYYLSHRLAWLYVYGEFPSLPIDHVNVIKVDNRIANLRSATPQQNSQNLILPHKGNKAGFLGVSPNGNKWKSELYVGKKNKYLGSFDTPLEAHEAYVAAKRKYHEFCTL